MDSWLFLLFISVIITIICNPVLCNSASVPKPVMPHFYHNMQNEFLERGCHDKLVGILIGRSGYITSRNFVFPTTSIVSGLIISTDGGDDIIAKNNNSSLITSYFSNEYCQWMIKATSGSRIRLRFTHFDVESGKHCVYDNVSIWQINNSPSWTSNSAEITPGNSKSIQRTLLGVFCGSSIPPIVESAPASSLLVVFQTDASTNRPGFRLVWETFSADDPLEQACSTRDGKAVVLNGPQGLIQLNHFDGKTPYSPNLRCAWKIQIPAGKLVRLQVEFLDIENAKDCVFDSLEIYDGGLASSSNRLGRYCGENGPSFSLTSTWNEMLVVFKSDNSTEKTGFRLKWEEVTLVGFIEMGCWQTRPALIRGRSSGTLHLPGYNGATLYAPNMDCMWYISGRNNSFIKIKIIALSIETEKKACLHDRLSFSHPGGNMEPITLCGENVPGEEIIWKSSELLIEFKSDDSIQATGFNLEWTEVPADDDDLPPPLVTQTDDYRIGRELEGGFFQQEWPTPPPPTTTTVQPTSAEIITNSPQFAPKFKLRQFGNFESHNDVSMELPDRRSLPHILPPPVDGSKSPSPFFSCQTPRRYYYSRAGKLTSPGFGLSDYPTSAHCSYVITVPDNNFVQLNFTHFDVEYSNDCEKDYVAVYEGESEQGKQVAKLCGTLLGKTVESSGNRILVVFHSNNETSFKGFSATFVAARTPNYAEAGCWFGDEEPAVITAESGVLTSRNFDGAKPYLYHQRCAWHIQMNESSRISIHFTHFSVESSATGCAGDTLAIYDGADKNAPVLGIFCGIAIPPPILSSGRDLFIKFTTDDHIEKTGFRFEWHAVPNVPIVATTTISSQNMVKTTMANSSPTSAEIKGVDVKFLAQSIVQASWPGSGIFENSIAGLPRGFISPSNQQPLPSPAQFFQHRNVPFATYQPPYHLQIPGSLSMTTELPGNIPPGVRRILDQQSFQQVRIPYNNPQQAVVRSAKTPSNSKEQFSSIKQLPFFARPAPAQSHAGFYTPLQSKSSESFFSIPSPVRKQPQIDQSMLANFDKEKTLIDNNNNNRNNQPYFAVGQSATIDQPPQYAPAEKQREPLVLKEPTYPLTFPTTTTPVTSTTTTTVTTTTFNKDECLANVGNANEDSATSSYYGTCDKGEMNVLTSRKAVNQGGIITSGSFDRTSMYPSLQHCVWSIRAPPGFRITVSFLHFDLERGRDGACPYDRVEFWDGTSLTTSLKSDQQLETTTAKTPTGGNFSSELGEFCGLSPRKQPIVSSGSALTIRFISDAVVQRTGFCLKWAAHPVESELLIAEEVGHRRNEYPHPLAGTHGDISASESSGCGGPKYMNRGSGHIKSPNYGSVSYYPNLDCRWVISAPPGKIVRVNLIDVDIEPDVSCRYDFLALYDGASEYASVIKRFCGRPRPTIVKSTSNTVYLQFRTDGTAEGKGFLIEYSFTDPPT